VRCVGELVAPAAPFYPARGQPVSHDHLPVRLKDRESRQPASSGLLPCACVSPPSHRPHGEGPAAAVHGGGQRAGSARLPPLDAALMPGGGGLEAVLHRGVKLARRQGALQGGQQRRARPPAEHRTQREVAAVAPKLVNLRPQGRGRGGDGGAGGVQLCCGASLRRLRCQGQGGAVRWSSKGRPPPAPAGCTAAGSRRRGP
jgi:hypothetical protein